MTVIGLTGPSGAGKSVVGNILGDFGIPSIDCDRVYHDLLVPPSPCLDAIFAHFGDTYQREDGTLDRKKLAATVFSDTEQLHALNTLTHRFVCERLSKMLEVYRKDGYSCVVLDAPTLYEAGADSMCEAVIAVLADRDSRVRRICARDGITKAEAAARIDAQPSDAFYRDKTEYIVENNGDFSDLIPAVRRILSRIGVIRT